jgi:hypothetical protein
VDGTLKFSCTFLVSDVGQGDPPQMMEQFFALLWGDLLVSRMLGASVLTCAEIEPSDGAILPRFC